MHGLTPHEKAIAAADGGEAAELLIGLVDLRVWKETHLDAPFPDHPVMSLHLGPGEPDQKLAELDAIARAWGTERVFRNGVYFVQRHFGPITLDAHWDPGQVIVLTDTRETAAAAMEAAA